LFVVVCHRTRYDELMPLMTSVFLIIGGRRLAP
jgi:hypothetical protein